MTPGRPSNARARASDLTFAHRVGGLRVYVQTHWPQVQRGMRTVRYPAHPLVLWVARVLKLPAWVTYQEAHFPNIVDAEPIHDRINDCFYCSPAQFDLLKRNVRASL